MRKILDFLDVNGSIDDEVVAYSKKDEYPFTLEEFRAFTHKIWDDAGGWDASEKYEAKKSYFETYHVPFENKKYYLVVMYGQGSAWTLFTKKEFAEYKKRMAKLD